MDADEEKKNKMISYLRASAFIRVYLRLNKTFTEVLCSKFGRMSAVL